MAKRRKPVPVPVPVPSGPQPPTARETRLALAEAGEFEQLMKILEATAWSTLNIEEIWSLALRAMEVRATKDPERFAADVYARMVSFSSCLMMRSHFFLGRRITQQGQAGRAGDAAGIDPHAFEDHVPKLVELQGHVDGLLQDQAATARAWQLARRGKIKNDKSERASSHPPRTLEADVAAPSEAAAAERIADLELPSPVVFTNGHPGPMHGNGKPANRIDGLLGVLGSGVGEAPHD